MTVPQVTAQAILNCYNDLPFTGVEKWVAGVVYFGYLVGRSSLKGSKEISNEEWETIFCTKIEKLRTYAGKLVTFYENNHHK